MSPPHHPALATRPPRPHSVQVIDHRGQDFDWADHDWHDRRRLAHLTQARCHTLITRGRPGCWFLTPRYSVTAPIPSALFFRMVRRVQGRWMTEFRRTIGRSHWRDLCRDIGASVLRESLAEQDSLPGPLPPDDTESAQREVEAALGRLGRYLVYSGLMIIDGQVLEPHQWAALEAHHLPDDAARIVELNHPVNLAALKATGDPQPLMDAVRSQLRLLLAQDPTAAVYATPAGTIYSPSGSQPFLERARRAESQWHQQLHRTFRSARRSLARAADWPTRLLLYHGTLIIDGRVYLPGCWPDRPPPPHRIKQSPGQSLTVTLSLLGIEPSHEPPARGPLDILTQVQANGPLPANEPLATATTSSNPDHP